MIMSLCFFCGPKECTNIMCIYGECKGLREEKEDGNEKGKLNIPSQTPRCNIIST